MPLGRIRWRTEMSNATEKKVSIHAATAKAIRSELKNVWPEFKFKVTSQQFGCGNSVEIKLPKEFDSDLEYALYQLVKKYQYGTTDCMNESYDMTNCRDDIPQVKFVEVSRSW